MRGAAVTIALVLCASAASAQTLSDSERAARVSLLSRADEARRGGRLDEALGLAQQAEQIGATAGTRMFIAQVNAQLRRYADASTSAEQCLRAVDIDTQTSVANRQAIRTACEAVRDEALRHVGRLVVRVPSGAPSTMIVRVNGQVLRPSSYGAEQVVEVGAVSVTATADGLPSWTQRAAVARGQTATVDVVMTAPAPAVERSPRVEQPRRTEPSTTAVVAPPDGVPVSAPTAPGATQRALGWASGVTGLVLVGGAAVAGLMFQGTASDYQTQRCEFVRANGECQSMYERLDTLNTLQVVGYVGGGALVATSLVLFLTAPSRERRESAVACGVGPGDVGVTCATRF